MCTSLIHFYFYEFLKSREYVSINTFIVISLFYTTEMLHLALSFLFLHIAHALRSLMFIVLKGEELLLDYGTVHYQTVQ